MASALSVPLSFVIITLYSHVIPMHGYGPMRDYSERYLDETDAS